MRTDKLVLRYRLVDATLLSLPVFGQSWDFSWWEFFLKLDTAGICDRYLTNFFTIPDNTRPKWSKSLRCYPEKLICWYCHINNASQIPKKI
ncbi:MULTISPECIES: hypothetical protein [unclassified Coleofasciculus]|uniref:hypothetical protein n=1 Tax=Cyanophyceae TaxID=3028117 RepID=UPI0016874F5D|nr:MULTISPECIES: hypothetical protein [unclassified Coleofasciculus]MBD1881241.1 hypothetical protein [Coleofasciculus sp. FACHB-T130]MBD1893359.1 hypothetical protein [Coleofasciculus sp. FACHB-129]